ncbi:MAG TPA: Hsp20/alpha crystallin family protein [Candidatus Saccharimonadales bacterium]|nr:Hsp20/alpha crystallin family protein [Candidatus Saccharimonadales bacterium]
MALVRWDPFSELNSLHEQVNSLFNSTFGNARVGSILTPPVDVYSDDKALTLEIHLSNFKDNEIAVQQHDGELEIKAEHEEKEESKDRKYLIHESVSRYYRRFALPKNADADNIQANYENGVLKVVVPYKELPEPKRIAISAKSKQSK